MSCDLEACREGRDQDELKKVPGGMIIIGRPVLGWVSKREEVKMQLVLIDETVPRRHGVDAFFHDRGGRS